MSTQLFVDQITYYKKIGGFIPLSIPLLNRVSFTLKKREILGLIGENGSGKSLLAKIISSIEPYHKGKIYFEGKEINNSLEKAGKELKKEIQLIFQNPEQILNPYMSGRRLIKEVAKSEELLQYYIDKLNIKNLDTPIYKNSSTEKQKIVIARTLSLSPSIVISDDSTSLMDSFQQAEVINFFKHENKEKGISMLFLSHDIYLIADISDNIAILYKGRVVEIISSKTFFTNLQHPYSKQFIYDIKSETIMESKKVIGCQYYSKCPLKTDLCLKKEPTLKEIETNHFVACHNIDYKKDSV
ncbi:ABC transporter ATP-binding protein [bacterium]|nr:ABC transporter ATP-binding protein [bacterium]